MPHRLYHGEPLKLLTPEAPGLQTPARDAVEAPFKAQDEGVQHGNVWVFHACCVLGAGGIGVGVSQIRNMGESSFRVSPFCGLNGNQRV